MKHLYIVTDVRCSWTVDAAIEAFDAVPLIMRWPVIEELPAKLDNPHLLVYDLQMFENTVVRQYGGLVCND